MENEIIHIACPCCNNKRLFDLLAGESIGIINIKCPLCRAVVTISLYNYNRHNKDYMAVNMCAENANANAYIVTK